MTRRAAEDLRGCPESAIFARMAKSISFRGRVRFYTQLDATQPRRVAQMQPRNA